jgi:ankyrin repeat protein
VRKLLERSAVNAEKIPKDADAEDEDKDTAMEADPDRPSSEDDWSSEEDDIAVSDEEDGGSEGSDGGKPEKSAAAADRQSEPPTNVGDLPEDEADLPDVFDINLADWDMTFTALGHAIVSGSLPIVEALINAGADVKLVSQAKGSSHAVLPLTLTIIPEDDERVCKIAERLILAGASCSAADQNMSTIFHRAVVANRPNLVATFLRCDPNGKAALNHLIPSYNGAVGVLLAAVSLGNYSVIAVLAAHGVKMVPSEEDVQRAFATR